jgi:hypothetical protein
MTKRRAHYKERANNIGHGALYIVAFEHHIGYASVIVYVSKDINNE